MFDTDHLNTFFLDNLPIFALGVSPQIVGPSDEPPEVPIYTIPSLPDMASHIRNRCVEAGFDLALVQEFQVDHSVVVPLHLISPGIRIPVIPIFVNGHVPPLPSAHRCFALGQAVRIAIQNWPAKLRVAVIGSGSFSLEVYGPRMAPGSMVGVPDPGWVMRICQLLERGDFAALLDEANPSRLCRAGNVAGELLNWIAMLGTIGARRANYLDSDLEWGHAYAAWSC